MRKLHHKAGTVGIRVSPDQTLSALEIHRLLPVVQAYDAQFRPAV
jgi:hypothetical protein